MDAQNYALFNNCTVGFMENLLAEIKALKNNVVKCNEQLAKLSEKCNELECRINALDEFTMQL